jgi:putative ABC transport system ATP-binding protein
MKPIISGNSLHLAFDGRVILNDVSIAARPGEIIAIVGESGAGKTTLIQVLSGFQKADKGEVHIQGERLNPKDPDQADKLRRCTIGYLAQDLVLLPQLTATQNVAIPLLLAGTKPKLARAKAKDALAQLGLSGEADRPAQRLSRGQRQRTALARALAQERPILLLDEPTSSLDPETRDNIMRRLTERAASGAAIVITTHDPDVAQVADTIWTLGTGRLDGPGRARE